MGASLKHLDGNGATQITSKNWGDIYAGATGTATKFFIENSGDRTLENVIATIEEAGDSDGDTMLRFAKCLVTVIPPYGLAAALSAAGAGGVWSTTGLKYFVVTATNATGQTTKSVEVYANVDVVTKRVTLTWQQVTGATGYKVYRSETAGNYGASSLRATIGSGSTTSYIDDGGGCSAGAPPSENTTAGAGPDYGTPPALGVAQIAVGTLAVGQQWCYWVNRVVPAGTPEAGNPRQASIAFTES